VKAVEELLRETMGFHAPTVGTTPVEHAVRAGMARNGLTVAQDYLKLLRDSQVEWTALVESIVVPETWFFRDREPFTALTRLVQAEWLPTHPTGKLRMLSVPCSTGEEPYSMSIALLDAGLPASRLEIDAIDISRKAITTAQRANYGKNSFRGKELAFRDKHFKFTAKAWCLKAQARQPVRFQVANILDEHCLPKTDTYDFIFCRNLLIYFDRPTQERVLRKLRGLLKDDGVLFVGSAEMPIATRTGFVTAHLPLSFACRKARPDDSATSAGGGPTKSATKSKATRLFEPTLPTSTLTPPAVPPGISTPELEQARQLAETGHLGEAAKICENFLRERGVSAQAYYLLGLARNAAGADAEATEFYRKALYLEPNHYDALIQWAVLSKKIGDGEQAQLLSERARRIRTPN
jgi:chemotaxis protein methyltransferase WspC